MESERNRYPVHYSRWGFSVRQDEEKQAAFIANRGTEGGDILVTMPFFNHLQANLRGYSTACILACILAGGSYREWSQTGRKCCLLLTLWSFGFLVHCIFLFLIPAPFPLLVFPQFPRLSLFLHLLLTLKMEIICFYFFFSQKTLLGK